MNAMNRSLNPWLTHIAIGVSLALPALPILSIRCHAQGQARTPSLPLSPHTDSDPLQTNPTQANPVLPNQTQPNQTQADRIEPNRMTPQVVGYVPNWIDLAAFCETIDYTKVTSLNISFENPIDATGTLSFNKQNDVLITKAHANNVQVLVSIGGGSASGDKALRERYFTLLSDASRAAFVTLLADYVVKHNFDGLDVDLEGPAINKHYGAFIRELADALKPKGKILTAALSQGYGGSSVPDSVFEQFDYVNVMAYDGTGPWNPQKPGQHSSLEFAQNNMAYWLKRGLPKSKAILGVPFYGYGFGPAFRNEGYAYATIVETYPGAHLTDQVGNTIWYNGIPTIQAKTQYMVDQGLAGIMIWSLDNDAKGEYSLLRAIQQTLKPVAGR